MDNAIKEREECEMDLSDSDEETSDTNASLPLHHTSNNPDDQKVKLHDDVLDQSKSFSMEKGLVNLEERDKFICKISVFLMAFPKGAALKTISSYATEHLHINEDRCVIEMLNQCSTVFEEIKGQRFEETKWKLKAF